MNETEPNETRPESESGEPSIETVAPEDVLPEHEMADDGPTRAAPDESTGREADEEETPEDDADEEETPAEDADEEETPAEDADEEETPAEADSDVEDDDEDDEDDELPGDDTDARPGLEKAVTVSEAHLKSVLESLIFVADKPVSIRHLARTAKSKSKKIRPLLDELIEEYANRGIQLVEVGAGFQFRSAVANAPFVRGFVARKPVRLSRAQLETLAIVSYRQPVTRPEVDEIRGVDSGSSLKVLLDRNLLKVLGRKDEAGRPLLYGTSPDFLDFFGNNRIQ